MIMAGFGWRDQNLSRLKRPHAPWAKLLLGRDVVDAIQVQKVIVHALTIRREKGDARLGGSLLPLSFLLSP